MRVATVILNWNKREDLLACLASVYGQRRPPDHVLVVDNASTDGSVEAVRERFPQVELLVHERNLGGSAGFNSGVRALLRRGGFDYVHLVDNDVILDDNTLGVLVDHLQENPGVGMAGSKILVTGGGGRLQELGAFVNWERFHLSPVGQGCYDGDAYGEVVEVDYVPACSLLLRGSAARDVGLMDEGNFLYWDDIEWGIRMNAAGYRVVAVPRSVVWHKMGSADRPSPLTTYYFWRNRFRFFNRATSMRRWFRFVLRYAGEWHDAQFTSLVSGKRSVAKALRQAVGHALLARRGRLADGRWPEDRLADAELRRELAASGRLVLVADGGSTLVTAVGERLRRSFREATVVLSGGGRGDAEGTGWTVFPVEHVYRSAVVEGAGDHGRMVLADRHNNLLRLDAAGRRRRALFRISRRLVYPLLVVVLALLGGVGRLFGSGEPVGVEV